MIGTVLLIVGLGISVATNFYAMVNARRWRELWQQEREARQRISIAWATADMERELEDA